MIFFLFLSVATRAGMAFRCGQKNVSKKYFMLINKFYSKKHKKSPMFTKFCQIIKSYIENAKKSNWKLHFIKKKFCRLNRKLFDAKKISSNGNRSVKPKHVPRNCLTKLEKAEVILHSNCWRDLIDLINLIFDLIEEKEYGWWAKRSAV